MKPNKFMMTISILTLFVILAGATFAYFSVSVSSEEGSVGGEAAVINIRLDILPLYTGKALIPTNDSDIDKAYASSCVDKTGNGACSAYTIKVRNDGQDAEYIGNINFDLTDITNLKYRLLDSSGNVYQDTVTIDSGQEQPLGNKFTVASGTEKTFTLIVWLPNVDRDQSGEDANGSYSATVTYTSSSGSKVTGMFSV